MNSFHIYLYFFCIWSRDFLILLQSEKMLAFSISSLFRENLVCDFDNFSGERKNWIQFLLKAVSKIFFVFYVSNYVFIHLPIPVSLCFYEIDNHAYTWISHLKLLLYRRYEIFRNIARTVSNRNVCFRLLTCFSHQDYQLSNVKQCKEISIVFKIVQIKTIVHRNWGKIWPTTREKRPYKIDWTKLPKQPGIVLLCIEWFFYNLLNWKRTA